MTTQPPDEHGLTPEQYAVNLDMPYTRDPPSIDWDGVLPGPGGFGMAHLKTEGEAIVYDTGAGPPGPPLTRWQRLRWRLDRLGERLRDTPGRVWWALFGGDDYYDDEGW